MVELVFPFFLHGGGTGTFSFLKFKNQDKRKAILLDGLHLPHTSQAIVHLCTCKICNIHQYKYLSEFIIAHGKICYIQVFQCDL